MNIGLVIVNYNDANNTIKLINNVKDYKIIKKIVVVDNKSREDDLIQIKKLKIAKLKIIENDNNYGYSYAMNMGARYLLNNLDDMIICFSNSDISVPSEEVFKSLSAMLSKEVKCVMPKIKEKGEFKYGWKLTSPLADLKANIPLINRLFRKDIIHYANTYFDQNKIIDVIYGCFFLIDGKTLKKIGYFDDKVFLYFEEYILARKLAKINKLSMQNVVVFVEHKHDAVIGSNISKKNKYKIYKKSQLYYEKNYNKANILEMVLFRLFYLLNLIPYELKSLRNK